MSSSHHIEKKDLSNNIIPVTYTLEKRFFAVAILLIVFESFLSRQSKTSCIILGLCDWSLDFHKRNNQINTLYEK